MAETALVIPILLGIVLFIYEFGSVFYISNSLSQIARSAVRYASVTSSYTQQNVIDASGANSLLPDIAKFTLTITPSPGIVKKVGDVITVNVQYNYTPIINPFGLFNSSQPWAPVLKSTAVARSEVSSA